MSAVSMMQASLRTSTVRPAELHLRWQGLSLSKNAKILFHSAPKEMTKSRLRVRGVITAYVAPCCLRDWQRKGSIFKFLRRSGGKQHIYEVSSSISTPSPLLPITAQGANQMTTPTPPPILSSTPLRPSFGQPVVSESNSDPVSAAYATWLRW